MMDTEAFNHSFLLCTLNKKKKWEIMLQEDLRKGKM